MSQNPEAEAVSAASNPYTPPVETGEAVIDEDAFEKATDFPGGFRFIAAIAFVVSLVLVGLALLGMSSRSSGAAGGSYFGPQISIWGMILFPAMSLIAALILPGSALLRIGRACLAIVLSFLAYVMYVPICGLTYAAVASGGAPEIGFSIGNSLACFLCFLVIAKILRAIARRSLRLNSEFMDVYQVKPVYQDFGVQSDLPENAGPLKNADPTENA